MGLGSILPGSGFVTVVVVGGGGRLDAKPFNSVKASRSPPGSIQGNDRRAWTRRQARPALSVGLNKGRLDADLAHEGGQHFRRGPEPEALTRRRVHALSETSEFIFRPGGYIQVQRQEAS